MIEPQAKERVVNPRPIRLVLAIGFILLLILIFLLGSYSTSKLTELRNAASDRHQRITGLQELAIGIREEAGRAIAEARLYRAARSLGIPGPAYRPDLAGAKVKLQNLLAKGRRSALAQTKTWPEVEKAVSDFWGMFRDGTMATDEEFFAKRQRLEQVVEDLTQIVDEQQRQSLAEIDAMQAEAAERIFRVTLLVVGVGIVIAGFTFALTQSQFVQLKRAVKLRQEAEDFIRSVLNSLVNDVLTISEEGLVLDANQAFLIHTGIREAELAGRDYREVLASLPEVATSVAKALKDRGNDKSYRERVEVSAQADESGPRLLDVYVSPLTVGPERRGRVVVLVDVTEAERAREELRRNRMLSAVGQMTAQVAHEIYNPLGALKLNVELLEQQLNGHSRTQETVERLRKGLDHLSSIVMDLRDLTRPRDPERQPADLNALLDDALELAGDRLQQKQIRLRREYQAEGLRGKFDPSQLRKVFLNLIINAVDASAEGAEINLGTRLVPQPEAAKAGQPSAERGAAAVSIIDSGSGMSAETKRRLFEPFYSTKPYGTGLGMMITQEIVKKHGGKIEVDSREGQGTTVRIYLPLSEP